MHTPGLRERKKLATMHELAAAAYELVRERGFDAVTIDDVVDRAGYSRRTFANHYASKQEAVVDGFLHGMRLLATGSTTAPPMQDSLEEIIDTMQAQVTALFTGPALDQIREFSATLREDRSLAPYLSQAFERDFDAALSAQVTRVHGVETTTLLLGAVAGVMLALMRLLTGATDGTCAPTTARAEPAKITDLIAQAFDHLRHGFLPADPT